MCATGRAQRCAGHQTLRSAGASCRKGLGARRCRKLKQGAVAPAAVCVGSGSRQPEPTADLERFATGLQIAWREGERGMLHRRPYRRKKPPRRPSMLDDLREQIGAWLCEQPGLPAIAILERIKTLHPDRFTDKPAQTVQRAVKRWRAEQARRIIAEGAVTIGGVATRPAA